MDETGYEVFISAASEDYSFATEVFRHLTASACLASRASTRSGWRSTSTPSTVPLKAACISWSSPPAAPTRKSSGSATNGTPSPSRSFRAGTAGTFLQSSAAASLPRTCPAPSASSRCSDGPMKRHGCCPTSARVLPRLPRRSQRLRPGHSRPCQRLGPARCLSACVPPSSGITGADRSGRALLGIGRPRMEVESSTGTWTSSSACPAGHPSRGDFRPDDIDRGDEQYGRLRGGCPLDCRRVLLLRLSDCPLAGLADFRAWGRQWLTPTMECAASG